jgi:hypothetical protein
MRKFSSYGQLDPDQHYYAPREALIAKAYTYLLGEIPEKGGHYITVWAPRQTGKSWVMLQVAKQLNALQEFDVAILTMESAKQESSGEAVLDIFCQELRRWFRRDLPTITSWTEFSALFTPKYFDRPLLLILDEMDSLEEPLINKFAGEFRKMYTARLNESEKKSVEKSYILHGLALIGVRSVLGIENVRGSPFNVQHSLHIPNLTRAEVDEMFTCYESESGQKIEQTVIERLYYETNGQPGLTCWFGELLTEGFEAYHPHKDHPITMNEFNQVFLWATRGLPNSNILNLMSKAKQAPYTEVVLELFKTEHKMEFRYDEPLMNFLYMNGVLEIEPSQEELYAKFASPFVQKRLFNYFSDQLFRYTGKIRQPFEDLSSIFTLQGLHIKNLINRFETYLKQNREWLLQDTPTCKDLRVYEAVYHFCLYRYLCDFLDPEQAKVYPEFPTGNGKIDLLIHYHGTRYGLELKSYSNEREYHEALTQAAQYGKELQLPEISLISFVEYINEETRKKYEVNYMDTATGVTVIPIFVETGK